MTDSGESKGWKFAKEAGGLGVAEGVSGAVSLGVVALAADLNPAVLRDASKFVARTCIQPFLEPIENGLARVCRLEECKPDKTQSIEERSEALARTLIVFSAAWVASMVAKMATRKGLNYAMDVQHHPEPRNQNFWHDKVVYRWLNKHDWNVLLWDEGVHIGSVILFNSVIPKQTDQMIAATKSMFQKTFGWSDKKAKEVADMAIIWELPNALGLAAGVGKIAHEIYGSGHKK